MVSIFKKISLYLNTVMVSNKYVFLNYWSWVHLCSGILIMLILTNLLGLSVINSLIALFVLVILWELFEYVVTEWFNLFYIRETFIDSAWDVIIGMLGGLLYLALKSVLLG